MAEHRFRLGLACPLPPSPTGPATYVVGMLDALAEHVDVTCFVGDRTTVDTRVRSQWDVRGLDERHDAGCDVIVYHLANNPLHREVLHAALEGPAGMVALHDASLHHLLVDELVAARRFADYADWLGAAHAARGRTVAEVRLYGGTEIEQFVFDALGPALDRHLGVQVHSEWARALVEHRCPGLPVFLVPHYAVAPTRPRSGPACTPDGTFTIGHFGFVTKPKRYEMLCEAVRLLIDGGEPVELVFVGEDHSNGDLGRVVDRLGLEDVVRVTGWVDEDRMADLVASVDMAVSLRWPQVGESSGTLATLLAAGVPTVVEAVGSWAEVPSDAVARVEQDGVGALAATLADLVSSPAKRQEIGAAAATYARRQLSVTDCAAALVRAARAVAAGDGEPPHDVLDRRRAAVAAYINGPIRRGAAVATLIERVPVARPGARLAAIGCDQATVAALSSVWGYEVAATSQHRGRLGVPSQSVDVVVCGRPVGPAVLRDINRALTARGTLHLVGDAASSAVGGEIQALLEDAGLSMATTRGDDSCIAHKCGVPSPGILASTRCR